jgi:hypothetical protein
LNQIIRKNVTCWKITNFIIIALIIRENVTFLIIDIYKEVFIIVFVIWRDKAMLRSNLSNQVMIIQKRLLYSFFGNPVATNLGSLRAEPSLINV